MLRIHRIVKNMQKELHGAENYIYQAIEEKSGVNDMDIVGTYLRLAQNELDNAEMLHMIAIKVVDKQRAEHGEPPEAMKQMWAYEHKDYVDSLAEVKSKLDAAKK